MLGFIVFITRSAMSHLRYLPRCVNIIYDLILLGLWLVSLSGQTSGDFSDLKHTSPHPWYLVRGCSAAWDRTRGYCHIAQASFAISIMSAILYSTRLLGEIVMIAYAKGQRHRLREATLDAEDLESVESIYTDKEMEPLDQQEAKNILALSPVLAFFPSDSESRW